MPARIHIKQAMRSTLSNDGGFAMVVALSFIVALSLLAGIIIAVAISEKRTTSNEFTHSKSFYSADAGGEAAVNWLRTRDSAPGMLDPQKHVFVPAGFDTLTLDERYRYDVTYVRQRMRPGWSPEYKDFEYVINADGSSIQESESRLEVNALRLFKEGYGR